MLTAKEFELFADFLGNHVIPELLTKVEYGGGINWDRVEQYLVKKFNENPNFKLRLFNDRMLGYAEERLREQNLHHMIRDLPGMRMLEERESPNWTFHLSNKSRTQK